jgi:hypothetical protein
MVVEDHSCVGTGKAQRGAGRLVLLSSAGVDRGQGLRGQHSVECSTGRSVQFRKQWGRTVGGIITEQNNQTERDVITSGERRVRD